MRLESYVAGKWVGGSKNGKVLLSAVNGEKVAEISSEGIDYKGMLEYARTVGNPNLRRMSFHERALMLKAAAKYLLERKDELYALSAKTGATKVDSWIDIEGGIGTFFVYSSKGRRELPDLPYYPEGPQEQLSKSGTFIGRHLLVPLEGCAVHINAFNFPCWGMLEKLAPTFLAGMPAIVKPASSTAYLAKRLVELLLESELLPEGALQIICGGVGDLFDHLTCQDVVTFTGSAETGKKLKQHPAIIENSVRFNMEADSINSTILGSDVKPEDEEFKLFIKEVVNEMTVKAGQKCTAIRRVLVPEAQLENVTAALKERLSSVKVGDPSREGVRMGALVSSEQREEVKARIKELTKEAEIVFGDPENFEVCGDKERGAFLAPVLLCCRAPGEASLVHSVEAFGPVSTVMPYNSNAEAISLVKKGGGSLVSSIFTADDNIARELTLGIAPYHGRVLIINRHSAKESTGHGSPMPHLVHGGPGRAGGGEEMGGIRGVTFYMQRVALQGSPTTLTHICNQWHKGAERIYDRVHPFRKYFDELQIGESITTARRTVTEADVVNFAGVSGDYFYAHMDDIAARESLFEKRVAHGYFVLSAAAGLFVDPAPGPVMANYGLDNLRFIQPVYIGDTIYVKLTVKEKAAKPRREDEPAQGVVSWDAEVYNQSDELVATYTILTLVRRRED
ncbi:MAG: phenylacetic acid degradation bifunctional protein PaaZ [Candidatus Dadabacteria bacterium]|nr:MAG: phenylacetic acid degradation bifunctional protein PaaZ [Candidatus Dadabacteria bacterium]